VVQPVQVIEEPVVQQIVQVNRRVVQGAPFVAGTSQSVVGGQQVAYGGQQAYGGQGMVVAGNQQQALQMDAADGVIDGRAFGAQVGVAAGGYGQQFGAQQFGAPQQFGAQQFGGAQSIARPY